MPRPSNTQERRKEIALALARVMARSGYDGATTNAIAREAGVAAGGVHYHFKSKGEILLDLVARVVDTAEARIARRLECATTPRDRLVAVLDGMLELGGDADEEAVAVWALIGAEAVRNEEVRAAYGAWIERAHGVLRDEFAAACRAEERRAAGSARAATALVALVEGFYAVSAGAPAVIGRGHAAPAARRIAEALLDAQEPA